MVHENHRQHTYYILCLLHCLHIRRLGLILYRRAGMQQIASLAVRLLTVVVGSKQ